MAEITQLLQKVQAGDAGAREALFAAAYPLLEKLARARLRDGGRSTLLDTRGLVHESYLATCGEANCARKTGARSSHLHPRSCDR